MLKKILGSFLLAFHNIRSHFFHTLLSTLGIVIGVAALVAILSLIDGLEEFAKSEITKTTSLKAIAIQPRAFKEVNGIRLKKDSFDVLQFGEPLQLSAALSKPHRLYHITTLNATATVVGTSHSVGAVFYGLGTNELGDRLSIRAGSLLTEEALASASSEALINIPFAKSVDSMRTLPDFVGQILEFGQRRLVIRGIMDDESKQPRVAFPLTLLTKQELKDNPPSVTVEANDVEDVPILKDEISAWLKSKYGSLDDFNVVTNEGRVAQAAKGFLIFRIVMGLIVGISVLVGGIGIMNVLLISITERTVEIGIRKAVGANRRDIILQFLAESITVSFMGSVMGLVLGILATMAFVPIISAVAGVQFYASYTAETLIVVGVIAIMLGITFGTYPAIRASRLDPVEAIRHE